MAELKGHTSYIFDLNFSRDSEKLFSGSVDTTIKIWDVAAVDAKSWTCWKTLVGYSSVVNCVSESPCGKYLAFGSSDKTIKVWDVATGAEFRTIQAHEESSVFGVSFEAGGNINSTSLDVKVKLFNLATKGRDAVKLEGHEAGVRSIAISADGKTLVSGGSSNKVCIWNAKTGKRKMTLDGRTKAVNSVAVSKDGTLVISASEDKRARIWNMKGKEGGEQNKSTLVRILKLTHTVAFAHDEKSFFCVGEGSHIVNFNVETGEEMGGLCTPFEDGYSCRFSVAVTSDGKWVVSSADNTISIFNRKSGKIVRTLKGHSDDVVRVAISPDEKKIVSGSKDKTVKVWSMKDGNLLHTFEGHTKMVMSVAIHPSGGFLATGSKDKTWKLWR